MHNIFITLDNAAAEGELVGQEDLLEIISELKPNEAVSPDVLFDKEQTLINLDNFIKAMKELRYIEHTNIFGCPQGGTKQEWIECYDVMADNLDVSVIGLSKITVPYVWSRQVEDQGIKKSRHACVDFLYTTNRLSTPLHFLGMGVPTEYSYYRKYGSIIRSSDSCYTVLAAAHGVDFWENSDYRAKTTNDFYERSLTQQEMIMSIKNIAFLKYYTNTTKE